MANQWLRLYSEFSTDPKVQMMSEAYQRRLIMLFCIRCNGDVTLQDSEVTFLLRISNEEWSATKTEFIARGFINEANNILNWDKRQFRSDSSRERVAKHREKQKQDCNVTVTRQNRTEQNRDRTEKKVIGSRFALSELPEEWILFCRQERPDLEPQKVFDQFHDYWIAKPGKDGRKINWLATWKNWVRNQKSAQPINFSVSKTDQALEEASKRYAQPS